jgi:hypothetical protein
VAAIAAAGGGFRSGGSAACRRVAGSIAAVVRPGGIGTAVVLAKVFAADVVFATTLRAIGRGFGSGTIGLAEAVVADQPTASARPAVRAVDKTVECDAQADRVTAFLRGESFKRGCPGTTRLNIWTKC